MELIEFFGVISLCLLFTKYFTPIQPTKDKLVEWLIGKIVRLGMWKSPFLSLTYLVQLLTCPFCLATWTLLFYTHNIFIAASGGVLTKVIDNIMVKTQNSGE